MITKGNFHFRTLPYGLPHISTIPFVMRALAKVGHGADPHPSNGPQLVHASAAGLDGALMPLVHHDPVRLVIAGGQGQGRHLRNPAQTAGGPLPIEVGQADVSPRGRAFAERLHRQRPGSCPDATY